MLRIVRNTPGTLAAWFYANDAAVTLDAPPTVTVTALNGAVVSTGTATDAGSGKYTYALPPQPDVALLTSVWSGLLSGAHVSVTTYSEIVGTEYFQLPELRNYDSVLSNTTKYTDDKLRLARLAVATEFEDICGRSFVPRYARETLYGDGARVLWLSNPQPLRIISCTVNGDDWSAVPFEYPDFNLRIVVLPLTASWFPRNSKIVIEYEYGMHDVPVRIKNAALKRAKYALVGDQSRIDERATVMNIPDFGNFTLSTPGMRGSYTGIPEVDVALQDYVIGSV